MATALITGGASGIGASTAALLTSRGWQVIVLDHVAASEGDRSFDVTEEQNWSSLDLRYDALINAAGVTGGSSGAALATATLATWQAVFRVNVEGTFLGCRHALNYLEPGGAIVNFASSSALMASPALAAYGASKAAVAQLTLSFAQQLAEQGKEQRCNAVAPGMVDTPLTTGLPAARRRQFEDAIPLGRFATTHEVAEVVAFLAGRQSRYVTGEIVRVDGGLSGRAPYRDIRTE